MVFFCENNGLIVSMRLKNVVPTTNIADYAAGYGVPGLIVDAPDAVAVYEATQDLRSRSRGQRPNADRGQGSAPSRSPGWRFAVVPHGQGRRLGELPRSSGRASPVHERRRNAATGTLGCSSFPAARVAIVGGAQTSWVSPIRPAPVVGRRHTGELAEGPSE